MFVKSQVFARFIIFWIELSKKKWINWGNTMCDRCSTQSDARLQWGLLGLFLSLCLYLNFFYIFGEINETGEFFFRRRTQKKKRRNIRQLGIEKFHIERRREGERERENINLCACKRANQQSMMKEYRFVGWFSEAYLKEKSSSSNDYDPSIVCLTLIFDRKWSFLRLLWVVDQQENSINGHISYRY